MQHTEQFRRALEDGDLVTLRGIWREAMPHLPQVSDDDAPFVMHHARTQCSAVSLKARAYSHRWLTERGQPSGLPDALKPTCERLCPKAVTTTGIAVGFSSPLLKPVGEILQRVMGDAAAEVYAAGQGEDQPLITRRMNDARAAETKRLFGRLNVPVQEFRKEPNLG